MIANAQPSVASDTTICGRCGSVLAPGDGGAVTCQDCLGSDLARELAEWFAETGASAPVQGLRAAGGFTLLEEIGHGGMGQVFRARQEAPDREVAVKLLMPHLSGSQETRRRFLLEAEAMAELEHPGLLPLYACGETDGRPWLATRLAAGGSLAQRRGRYSGRWRSIAELIADLADAIQHAHARGIIHRDLKPSNVLFDGEGGACIADFGLAKWRDDNSGGQTLSNAMMGTPAYMAPELVKNGARTATTAADVYGLGAILYELLTERAPCTGESPAEILLNLADTPPPRPRTLRPEVPRDLEVICLRALAREPSGRYETAAALAADLRRFVRGETVSARPYSTVERLVCWARRRPMAAGLTSALLGVLGVSATLLVTQNAKLNKSNKAWQQAVGEAENLVVYNTDILPEKLIPLARLRFLDSTFEYAAKYYDLPREIPKEDRPVMEAKKAAFYVRWGRILHRQGRIPEAEKKLNKAASLCEPLITQPGAPPGAWTALSRARLILGVMAARKDYGPGLLPPGAAIRREADSAETASRAETLFTGALETAEEGLRAYPDDPELLAAKAEAMMECCELLIAGEGGDPAALDALEAAWQAAVNKAENPSFLRHEYLREMVKVHHYRGVAAESRNQWPEAEKHYRNLLARNKQLAVLETAGDEDQRDIVNSHNRIVLAMIGDTPIMPEGERRREIDDHIAQELKIVTRLMESDPSNLLWRTDAALVRLQEAVPGIYAKDYKAAIPPLEEAARLIRNVPDEVSPVVSPGRAMILNALTRQLWHHTGRLSMSVKNWEDVTAIGAAMEAADPLFKAAVEAFPVSEKLLSQKGIETSWKIWSVYGSPGYAQSRLQSALDEPNISSALADYLKSQLEALAKQPPVKKPAPKPDTP